MLTIKAVDYFTCKDEKRKLQILVTNINEFAFSQEKPKYFSLCYDMNPIAENPSEKVAGRLQIVSQSAVFSYSSVLLKKLKKGFSLQNQSQIRNILSDIYTKGIEQLTLEAQNSLKYVLQKNVAIAFNIDLKVLNLRRPGT